MTSAETEQFKFNKVDSLHFWISDAAASEITVEYGTEKYNSYYPAYLANIKS